MRCTVYPYSRSIAKLIDLIPAFNHGLAVISAVSPRGYRGETHTPCGVPILNEYESALKEVECVIYLDDIEVRYHPHKDLISKIKSAIAIGKNVIACVNIPSEERLILEQDALKNGCSFIYKGALPHESSIQYSYQPQTCAVVGIGNAFRGMDESATVAQVAYGLREHGYRVSGISTNPSCGILGFEILPRDILLSTRPFENTIRFINQLMTSVQLAQKPDAIVFQYTDALLKYSNFCPEDYGVSSYLFSQAIALDYLVLQVPMDVLDSVDISHLSTVFDYRLGHALDSVVMHHEVVNQADSLEEERVVLAPAPSATSKIAPFYRDEILVLDSSAEGYGNQIVADIVDKLGR